MQMDGNGSRNYNLWQVLYTSPSLYVFFVSSYDGVSQQMEVRDKFGQPYDDESGGVQTRPYKGTENPFLGWIVHQLYIQS